MTQREAQLMREIAKETINELLNQNLIKKSELTPHKKTEQLLYYFPDFKEGLKIKEETIFDIEIDGIPKKSNSVTIFSGIMGGEFESELEKKETRLDELRRSVELTKKVINLIESTLNLIKDDKYYDVIPLKYWEGKTHEEIAEIFNKEVSTISKNKIRLISKIKVTLFSDDVIREIFG